MSLPDTIREAFYGGGAGSAKTDTLLHLPLVRRFHENPRFKQVFMRRTFAELRKEVIPRSREIYRKFGATFNASNMVWTFPRPDQLGGTGLAPDGALIYMAHCENEDDVHQYDSMEINLYTPDELTSYTEYIYLYIAFTRVRSPQGSGLPAIVRAAGMPGDIGHSWVKKRFVDPHPAGGKIIIGKGGNKRIYIFATQADNPYIDPNYKQGLLALPEAEKQAKLFGSWDAYLGQVFEEFRDKKYPDEPDNALHVIKPFDIPDYWPKLLVGDWGKRAMAYWGWFAISPSKRMYLYREQHWRGLDIEEWAPHVKELINVENPALIKLCKSAGQDRGQGHTILQQVADAFGRNVELTDSNPGSRVATKTLLHEYLRWRSRYVPESEIPIYNEEYAQWILRNKTLADYKNYLASCSPPEVEENIPKLLLFDTCPVMADAIKACAYEKPGSDGKKPEDVAEFDGDDPYDVCRYAVDAADRYFMEADKEFRKIQERELLLQEFKQTGDWNHLYRNARKIEQINKPKFVRRYHHLGVR